MTQLTQESIIKARQWYAENSLAQAEAVKSGKTIIYGDKKLFFIKKEKEAQEFLSGKYDNGLGLRQRAHYIQTGESVPLLGII